MASCTNFIPHFIHDKYRRDEFSGSISAATILVDLSGFTRLADEYASSGKAGAERLADTLHAVFNPLLKDVYERGGFVTGFAGDAFTAVFPEGGEEGVSGNELERSYESAAFTCRTVESICRDYGIALGVRVGLSRGDIRWGIVGDCPPYAFYFRGNAMDRSIASKKRAGRGQIVAPVELRSLFHVTVRGRKIRTEPFVRLPVISVLPPPSPRDLHSLSTRDIAAFVPEVILDREGKGEFRDVAPVFMSFRDLIAHDEIREAAVLVMSISTRLGGYLSQIEFGDKGCIFVVLFGAPVSYERNADRAVEFTLACGHESWPTEWRAGSACGTVWTGIRGSPERCEYGAIGDTMNVSARLAMQASWGETLIARSLRDRLKRNYAIRAAGSMLLKGRHRHTETFRVEDLRGGEVPRLHTGDMIGREDEFGQLKAFVYAIMQGNFAGIAHIRGDAGTGKSRLVHELQSHHNIPSTSRVEWITCTADEVLHFPLLPIRQGLKRHFDQFEAGSDITRKERFSAILNDCITAIMQSDHGEALGLARELRRLESVIGALLDLHWEDSFYERLDPALRFESTINAVRVFIKGRSILHPVVLLVEDVHWLDEESGHLLRRLPYGLENSRVAFLFTSRHRDDGTDISIVDGTAFPRMDIELADLAGESIDILASRMLGNALSERLRDSIHTRTGGNPFFIEQLILHMKEEGFLVTSSQGEWDLRNQTISVPSGIGEILMARFDRLPIKIRDLIQRAAVLGREFDARILEHMHPEPGSAGNYIRHAEDEGIWSASVGTRYAFFHTLMRDAAYDMQTTAMKRNLHAGAVSAFEDVHGDALSEIYADLVYHSHGAGDSDRERRYAFLAGKDSASRYANTDAERYLARALELTPEDEYETRFTIMIGLFEVFGIMGRRKDQRRILSDMYRIAESLGEDTFRVQCMTFECQMESHMSNYDVVIRLAKKAASIAETCAAIGEQVTAYDNWAVALMYRGEYERSRELIKKGLVLAESADLTGQILRLHLILGVVIQYEGDKKAALDQYTRALRIARENNKIRNELAVLTNIGNLHAERGHYREALSYHETASRLAREIGAVKSLSGLLTNLGNVFDSIGNRDEAMTRYREALRLCREIEHQFGEGNTLGNMGMVASADGLYEESISYHEHALKIFRKIGYRWGEAWTWECLAGIAASMGMWNTVDENCNKARSIYQDLGDEHGQAMIYRWMVLSALDRGNNELAETYAVRMVDIAGKIEDEPILGEALTYFGRVEASLGKMVEAVNALQKAVSLYQSRGEEHRCVDPLVQLCDIFLREEQSVEAYAYAAEIENILTSNRRNLVLNPIDAYYTVFLVRRSTGDEYAGVFLKKPREVLDWRAGNISDDTLRRSYLTNRSVHRSILELT